MPKQHHKKDSRCPLFQKVSLGIAIALLAGCSVGPDFVSPETSINIPDITTNTEYANQYPTSNDEISRQWWSLFNDPVLSDLEKRASAANLDLQILASRIEQSRANLGITTSAYSPQVSANANYAREDISDNSKFAALGAKTSGNNYWQVGFDASWEIDLWGHIKRAQEGATAEFNATIFDREAFKVTLMAEVASNYLRLRGTQAQLNIAQQNKQIAEHKLQLVKSQQRNGLITNYETSMAQAQLASVNALIPTLVAQRNKQIATLALLLDENPNTLRPLLIKHTPLPGLPDTIPIGVPSQLIHQRPDVLSSEARLHKATAAIGVAQSNFYPRVKIVGHTGFEAFESGDLDTWDSSFFSLGPALYLPIFQGGKLKQHLKLTEEKQKAAALTYRKTVRTAWYEVENALDNLASQREHHEQVELAFQNYKKAFHIAQRQYQQGAGSYLDVLTSQRDLLDSQMALNDSATSATLSLVSLYKALGGGWKIDDEVSDEQ